MDKTMDSPLTLRSAAFLVTLATLSICSVPAWAGVTESIGSGDEAWIRRAEGHQGPRAAAAPIQEAIAAYETALEAEPENLEARWKLLRALYFKGEFVFDEADARLDLFEQGREIADLGRQQIERQYGMTEDSLEMNPQEVATAIGGDSLAAEIYFWSSTHWGLWGRYRGKIAAARQGVATKIRKFAEIVILLDENIENAGGHRVLGRLNAEAPKIPLITGWISRDRAISELRLALEIAPQDLLTNFFLAEALLEFRPQKEEEAMKILHAIVESDPNPSWLVEEIKTIEDAKAVLTDLED